MSYTPEQLSKMSDDEVELAVSDLLGLTQTNIEDERSAPENYCTDWSATGPLMVEFKVFPRWSEVYGEYVVEHGELRIRQENPLRAICEVLLQMGDV